MRLRRHSGLSAQAMMLTPPSTYTVPPVIVGCTGSLDTSKTDTAVGTSDTKGKGG